MSCFRTLVPAPIGVTEFHRAALAKPGFAGLVLAAATIGLSACGGGDNSNAQAEASATTVTAAATADVSSGASAIQTAATAATDDSSRMRTLDATGSWTTIANENQTFTVTGTQTVRYGAGSAWISMQFTGGGSCSNAGFGNDPVYGVAKQCQVAAADTSTPTTWTTVANEGQNYTVSGTQTVRYGTGTAWISMSVTGGGSCSNTAFGSDPAYGVGKQCQVASATTTTPVAWSKIATEGADFSVSGTQTVRFGAGTSWITKTVSSSGSCTNGFFGSDPAYGSYKECDLASSGTSTPTPTPTPAPVVAGVCTAPIAAVDTSTSTATVGNGSPASCTEAALRAAVNAYGTIRFNCGSAPMTIAIAAPIAVPTNRNTVIDGENRITLDGGNKTRIMTLVQNNYRTNNKSLTLQHLTLANGQAPAGGYVAPNPSNPSCAYGYATGAGAAILVQDAVLRTVDVTFKNNAAASPGPDVGGGAIYALGSLEVTVSSSTFTGNSGSNAGAVGMLNSNLSVYNSSFSGNNATGVGRNYQSSDVASCPGVGQPGQGGAGGGGGAIGIDGGDDTDVVICGSTFVGNHANELGGAIARTPDGAPRRTTLDRSVFSANSAGTAGAVYLMNSAPLEILASTFDSNTATGIGAAQLMSSTLNIVNSTFSNNQATKGVAGALFLGNNAAASVIRNTTFADNKANGGSGYFSAAIFGDNNFSILNTLFVNNTTGDAYNPMQCTFSPAPGANDLQWPRVRAIGGATDTACVNGIGFADPLLGALADNGGPTQTRAPAATSPARGAGRNCPATDQRGNPRNTANCTLGAVE